MQLLLFWSAVLQAVAQDYLYEKLTGGGSTCSAGFNDITSSADCQTAATEGQGTWNTALSSAAYPSGCSYEVASGDIFYNSLVVGALVPDGTTYAIICRQSTTTITTSSVTITTTSQTTKTDTTTSFSSTSTSSTSTSSSSTSSSSSTTSSTTSSSTSSTSSSSTSTSSTSSSSTSTSSSTTSSTSITSTTTTTSTTPPDIFNVTWVQSYVRPVTNAEIAISCYPTSCNEHAIAFLAAIDPLSVNFVDTTCASVTEMPLQRLWRPVAWGGVGHCAVLRGGVGLGGPMTVYDSVSARVVVRMTQPQYLSPQEGSSPIVDYKSAWEPVVDWTVNWTLQVVEGTELRMGRSYRLCIDESGPGGYNGPQLGDVTEMIEVYVAGIREADDGIAPSNNSRVEVLCEPTGDLYQLGCQTFMGYNEQSNPGATSAYLAVSCDTSDNDGWRESLLDNESASSYLMGDGNPYFYLEFDTRDMQLGVHYRLCEDLDGTGTVASFNWPGIVVYLGGVTSLSTVLRDPKDGPVVTAALGSESAAFTFRGSSEEWQWEPLGTPNAKFDTGKNEAGLGMWDLSNLTNGSTYKLCTDLDGLAQGPLHSGFSGLWVPVTPVTQISEESIQVLLLCYGCWNTERYCDTVDPIYEVSSAYLTTKACNFSDNDGFQMDEGGKEAVVYNTEVIFDASATVIGLCLDLDGAGTRFSFHDTGFSVYVTPVSVVRHQVLVIGLHLGDHFSLRYPSRERSFWKVPLAYIYIYI
ncbi:unnamed protein product [Durusdinium trenchii]|uniref:Uncharacterized protein n=1 Tax=Durusdinium trenchii TaxID=1381693 RepID=A0ABP0LHK6_9DINO